MRSRCFRCPAVVPPSASRLTASLRLAALCCLTSAALAPHGPACRAEDSPASPPARLTAARTDQSVRDRLEADLRRAENLYLLEASVPGLWSDVDLLLLSDDAPVRMNARLRVTKQIAPGLREVSRTIRWTAESGTVESGEPDAEGGVPAVWTPPAGRSALVNVAVHAEISLKPILDSASAPPRILRKSVSFRFVTPLSGAGLSAGVLDNYELGEYLDPLNPPPGVDSVWPALHPDRYAPPRFFYRVDQKSKAMRVSPHLTFGHFVIDYPWGSLGMPQYVAIDINLLEKVEDLVAMMKADGRRVSALTAIYGFRSPRFNLGAISDNPEGNLKVEFSMHSYGRALDFIVDEDGDLMMDDLNEDGVIDMYDSADIMHYVNILDRKYRSEEKWEKVGGAGLYDHHDFTGRIQTPYIHVDTRGFQSQSGTLIRWPDNWPDGSPIRFGSL